MEQQLRQMFEQGFPGMSHAEIAVFLLAATGIVVLISCLISAAILRVKALRDFGIVACILCFALAVIRQQMG